MGGDKVFAGFVQTETENARVDQPPRVVPPTVLVRPPPEAWGEGLGVWGD